MEHLYVLNSSLFHENIDFSCAFLIQKRLLQLWTESPKKEVFSLVKSLGSIDSDLVNIMYPSTTTRSPRSIMKPLKLKANECRVLLTIGYPVFKKYLPEKYYIHLQKLAFGIHIGESSSISQQQLSDMDVLLSSFVDDFPYHERYIVQTIHCVKHFATTTKDFGPLSNYSTFNFESIIGKNTKIFECFIDVNYLNVSFIHRMFMFVSSWHKRTWC